MTVHILTFDEKTSSFTRRLRSLLGAMESVGAAHDARRQHVEVSDRDLGDVGMLREDALGVPSFQPELPFFMQSGFGTHRA